jgi:hypothetical protein
VVVFLLTGGIRPAGACDHGETEIFAVLPDLPAGPLPSEGLTVDPDGTAYTPSWGIKSKAAVPGPPHLFSFKPNGQLLSNVALVNPGSPQPSTLLLGLGFQKSTIKWSINRNVAAVLSRTVSETAALGGTFRSLPQAVATSGRSPARAMLPQLITDPVCMTQISGLTSRYSKRIDCLRRRWAAPVPRIFSRLRYRCG